jgi:hypothetical protein
MSALNFEWAQDFKTNTLTVSFALNGRKAKDVYCIVEPKRLVAGCVAVGELARARLISVGRCYGAPPNVCGTLLKEVDEVQVRKLCAKTTR